ncbi:hypothetical protein ACX1NB_02115 [Mycoplasma sp. HF14]
MKTKRKILIISTLTFSTSILSCVSSPSCETKNIEKNSNIKYKELEERLILNGSELFDNDKLAQKYNEIKKSNVKIIKEINRKLSAPFKMLYLKEPHISINSTVFIDWNKLEEILNYYEKFKYEVWYSKILESICGIFNWANFMDKKIDFKQYKMPNKSDLECMNYYIWNNFIQPDDKNDDFLFMVIFNNYLNYILDLLKSIDKNEISNSVIYNQRFSDILKSIIMPSAYVLNPEIISDDSYFSTLKNTTMWDVLNNKANYSSSIIDLFDFNDNNYPRLEEDIKLPQLWANDEVDEDIARNDDNNVKDFYDYKLGTYWYLYDYIPKVIIDEWKTAKKDLNKNYDNDLIKEIKNQKINNDDFINIEMNLKREELANFSYSYLRNDAKNETEITIIRDKAVHVDFYTFYKKYQELLKAALGYILNINALNLVDKLYKEEKNHNTSLTWELMKNNRYSGALWRYLAELTPEKYKRDILVPVTFEEKNNRNKQHSNSVRIKVIDWLYITNESYLSLSNDEKSTKSKSRFKEILRLDESKVLDDKAN